jgi:diguanylate cyclase (GGDEF)-like protein
LVNVALYQVRALRALGALDEARGVGAQGLGQSDAADARAVAELHGELTLLEEQAGNLAAALTHHRRFHALLQKALSETALRRSAVAAVQLQTERAMADAATARAQALELQRRNEALRDQADKAGREAMTDGLTGLANRRRIDDRLQALEGAGPVPPPRPMTVALVDIDHFKRINDRFGHPVGDAVLREMGGLLSRSTRGSDLAARYGGEEFMVLFDGAGLEQAERACERMRASVQQHDWTSLHPDLAVTISIGLCPLEAAADIRRVVALADQALYRAKRTGRNRVCSQREPAGAASAAAAARDGADVRVVASPPATPDDPTRHAA